MIENKERDKHHRLRLTGLVIGIVGAGCALVSAYLSLTHGHYARGYSTLGAAVVFGTIFISQYSMRRKK